MQSPCDSWKVTGLQTDREKNGSELQPHNFILHYPVGRMRVIASSGLNLPGTIKTNEDVPLGDLFLAASASRHIVLVNNGWRPYLTGELLETRGLGSPIAYKVEYVPLLVGQLQ